MNIHFVYDMFVNLSYTIIVVLFIELCMYIVLCIICIIVMREDSNYMVFKFLVSIIASVLFCYSCGTYNPLAGIEFLLSA